LLEVICGPMFSGKTDELIRLIRRSEIAKLNFYVFYPTLDKRQSGPYIKSRSGYEYQALGVDKSLDIIEYIINNGQMPDVVFIDECQFFDSDIVDIVKKLVASDVNVIVSGLDLDYKASPFGSMPELMALADKVHKLTAVCMKCRGDANRTKRIKNNSNELIVIDDNTNYEARCIKCYALNEEKKA